VVGHAQQACNSFAGQALTWTAKRLPVRYARPPGHKTEDGLGGRPPCCVGGSKLQRHALQPDFAKCPPLT
jgi:hypothetical protein